MEITKTEKKSIISTWRQVEKLIKKMEKRRGIIISDTPAHDPLRVLYNVRFFLGSIGGYHGKD